MKVQFKLTHEQQKMAVKIAARVAKRWDEFPTDEDNVFDQGNLVDPIWIHGSLNTRQCLDLSPGCTIVRYVGERHPLQQDGGMTALLELAGYWSYEPYPVDGDLSPEERRVTHDAWIARRKAACKTAEADQWRRLEVVVYETSDKRLRWYETLESFIGSRASLEDLMNSKRPWEKVAAGWDIEAAFPNLSRFGILPAHLAATKNDHWGRLAAELGDPQLRFLRHLRHVQGA